MFRTSPTSPTSRTRRIRPTSRAVRRTTTITASQAQKIELRFDPQAATVDAIQRAVYKLSDRLSADIVTDDGGIDCTLFIGSEQPLDETLADFRNEVVDQVLRARIRQETEAARNLILSLAFSQTGLLPEH